MYTFSVTDVAGAVGLFVHTQVIIPDITCRYWSYLPLACTWLDMLFVQERTSCILLYNLMWSVCMTAEDMFPEIDLAHAMQGSMV